MIRKTNVVFKDTPIKLEANIIQCENHTLQITNISRIWTGKRQESALTLEIISAVVLANMAILNLFNGLLAALTALVSILFLTLKNVFQKDEGLHIQLCSGDIYSFISENESFVNQVYMLLDEILMNKKDMVHYSINFVGDGEIIDHFAVPPEEPEMQKVNAEGKNADEPNSWNERLVSELHTLYQAYNKKNVVEQDILSLIEQTADKIKSNDVENLKELYEKYLKLGLIIECNDLGLNELIDEIKKRVFT